MGRTAKNDSGNARRPDRNRQDLRAMGGYFESGSLFKSSWKFFSPMAQTFTILKR
jgi:hypothetical protein